LIAFNFLYNGPVKLKITLFSISDAVSRIFCSVIHSIASGFDQSVNSRPLADGSELVGDYNFRTHKMDSGADPYGWYEDDL
jgi:hypothetical protein